MRKKLFIFLALFFIGLIFPLYSFAQDDPDPDSEAGLKNRFGVEIAQDEIDAYIEATSDCSTPSLECLVKNTVTFTMIELTHNIIGDECALNSDEMSQECYSTETSSVPLKRGFIGDAYQYISLMYAEPPAKTSVYVADVLNSAHIATPAYAQGLGFAALDPILELWKKFRNIAYLGFIFIFIIIGFMIMFRAKIGGQTAVTAQQAIPNVIVSLLFVTFSYAIAGILIDAMYVIMFMMVSLFDGKVTADVINYNIFGLAKELFSSQANLDAFNANKNVITEVLNSAGATFLEADGIGGFIGGLTITVVLAIALLIATFKLFFELLKSYASIVMNVVIAPIVLMAGAIPGKNVFKPWVQGLIGNLAAFPTVLLMLIIYKEFTIPVSGDVGGGFVPPFLLNLGVNGIIGYIMGLAVVLALPEVVSKVKKSLGATDGFGFEIAKAAAGRTLAAAPLGMIPTIGGLAAAGGAINGLARGIYETRGDSNPFRRALTVVGRTGRGVGNALGSGSRFAKSAANFVGGKTPSEFEFAEKAMLGFGQSFSDAERLKRIAEGRTLLGRTTADTATYASRLELAKRQAEKRTWEEERLRRGEFGTAVDKPSSGDH